MNNEILKQLLDQSLTGKGARGLSSDNVEEMMSYTDKLNYILQTVEANMIEKQADRPMAKYSIFGPLPKTGKGIAADKEVVRKIFLKIKNDAELEPYPIRYDVWFMEY